MEINTTNTLKQIAKITFVVLYMPIYVLGLLLHKFARVQLALAYYMIGDFEKANDIIKYLFDPYGHSKIIRRITKRR